MIDLSTQSFEGEKKEELEEKLEDVKLKQQEKETIDRATSYNMPYVNLKETPIAKDVLSLVSEREARQAGILSFYKVKDMVRVAIVDPEDEESVAAVEKLEKDTGFKISLFLTSAPSFNYAAEFYKQIVIPKKKEEIGLTAKSLQSAQKQIKNLSDLKKKIHEVSATEVVNIILAGAIISKASDIHIEPEENDIKLRYRLDGILHNIAELDKEVYDKLLSRIKLVAGLKINVNDIPQDGRITVKLEQGDIDLRISVLPSGYGESIVMRLLGTGATELDITKLGFQSREQELLLKLITKPTGMILTTGPTGSGKTTTLYACLNQVNSPEVKIITLENPIEYRLAGVQQTPINPEKGMTFAGGLRSILRQDPDIVMVGEIRDEETAEIASQAALTGHLVFSTLHTNDAAGAIPRLLNMGLRPHTVAPSLAGVIGQRLVRRLCQKCRQSYTPSVDEVKKLKTDLGNSFPKEGVKKLYKAKAKGCAKCGKIGFQGRVGLYELIEITKEMKELINQRASSLEIEKLARKQGMITMRQDGMLKVIAGATSLVEVERVV
ncbi:MAG: type II/IV secretion system protein [Parcubacteria group bacterium]|nr:type II/IV secretion system protein [Parcubacteria group bacterium]